MGGSGVGLYVRDTFSAEVLAGSDPLYDNTPEYIICELRKGQLRLLFAAVYRRSHASNPINFFDCITNYLLHFPSVIITEDFNMNMALPNSPDATHLNNSICSNSLFLVRSYPHPPSGSTSSSSRATIAYSHTRNLTPPSLRGTSLSKYL